MILSCEGQQFKFQEIGLKISKKTFDDTFSYVNGWNKNTTLKDKIERAEQFEHLKERVNRQYLSYLDWHFGKFLGELKKLGDTFYLEFLNDYGELPFCKMRLTDRAWHELKGLYLFSFGPEIHDVQYIGIATKSYKVRINSQYGSISPQNCFKEGQHTNCRLNNLILLHRDKVRLFACAMDNIPAIKEAEEKLIGKYDPPWNIQFSSKP